MKSYPLNTIIIRKKAAILALLAVPSLMLSACGGDSNATSAGSTHSLSSSISSTTTSATTSTSAISSLAAGSSESSLGQNSSAATENSFTLQWVTPAGPSTAKPLTGVPRNLATLSFADLDGDGDRDAIATFFPTNDSPLAYFDNNGQVPASYTQHNIDQLDSRRAVTTGDLNGDGAIDILAVGDNQIDVYWAVPSAGAERRFEREALKIPRQFQPTKFQTPVIADFNGDGLADLLLGSSDTNHWVWFDNQGGDRPDFAAQDVASGSAAVYQFASFDMDADADMDIVAVDALSDRLVYFRNDGENPPRFEPIAVDENLGTVKNLLIADFNGDGAGDIIVHENYDAYVYTNNGVDRNFSRHLINTDLARSIQTADLDSDGTSELIVKSSRNDIASLHSFSQTGADFTNTLLAEMPSVYENFTLTTSNGGDLTEIVIFGRNTSTLFNPPVGGQHQTPPILEVRVKPSSSQQVHLSAITRNLEGNRLKHQPLYALQDVYPSSIIDLKLNKNTGQLTVTAPADAHDGDVLHRVWVTATVANQTIRRLVEIIAYRDDNDDDNDGIADALDAFPLDSRESIDSDGDGVGNYADLDDDNDGTLDINDAFPFDASETVDTDNDGQGNNTDSDDDNDGVPDTADGSPLNANSTLSEPFVAGDTDQDGVLNIFDNAPLDTHRYSSPLWQNSEPYINRALERTPAEAFDPEYPLIDALEQAPNSFIIVDNSTLIALTDAEKRIIFKSAQAGKIDSDDIDDAVTLWAHDRNYSLLWHSYDSLQTRNAGSPLQPREIEHHLIKASLLDTPLESLGSETLSLVDLNNDNKLDILISIPDGSRGSEIRWYENDGNSPPHFQERLISTSNHDINFVQAVDFNNDGHKDIAAASDGTLSIYWHSGQNNQFTEQIIFDSADNRNISLNNIMLGDIDNNGFTDILSMGSTLAKNSPEVSALFGEPSTSQNDDESLVNTGLIAYMNSGGQFLLSNLKSPIPADESPTLTDMNNDGKLDIIFLRSRYNFDLDPKSFFTTQLYWLENNTEDSTRLSFNAGLLYELDGTAQGIVASDLDQDNDTDIILYFSGSATPSNFVLLENNRAFDTHDMKFTMHRIGNRNGASAPSVTDFDGNSIPEIVAYITGGLTSQQQNSYDIYLPEGGYLEENLLADDADSDTLNYTIVGGPDAESSLLQLNATSGALQFGPAPLRGNAADNNRDNIYEFFVGVSDGISRNNLLIRISVFSDDGDADDDGTPDSQDQLPHDPRYTKDNDHDGLPDEFDQDNDNDGVIDSKDNAPFTSLSQTPPVWPEIMSPAGDSRVSSRLSIDENAYEATLIKHVE